MHPISSLLHPWSVLAKDNATSTKRVLETIANLLAENYPNLDSTEVFYKLLERERLGSTCIGHGIAIPHCRITHCTHPLGALIQLKKDIDFDNIDRKPVNLVFAMVVPEQENEAYLTTLSAIVKLFRNESYRLRLKEAQDNASLYERALETDVIETNKNTSEL